MLQPGRSIPPALHDRPAVEFQAPFLLAVVQVVEPLNQAGAPTRALTVEHPPPVVKPGLLPIALPGERCWRDDRMRINYTLPRVIRMKIVSGCRLLRKTGFTLTDSPPRAFRATQGRFPWFDPRASTTA